MLHTANIYRYACSVKALFGHAMRTCQNAAWAVLESKGKHSLVPCSIKTVSTVVSLLKPSMLCSCEQVTMANSSKYISEAKPEIWRRFCIGTKCTCKDSTSTYTTKTAVFKFLLPEHALITVQCMLLCIFQTHRLSKYPTVLLAHSQIQRSFIQHSYSSI